jgi:hypothetical protein
MMRIKIILLFQFILLSFCYGQTYDPIIEGIINQTNLDTLVSYVRIFSGEDSVLVGDSTVLISSRVSSTGNNLAAEYIRMKLENYGLEVYDQQYSGNGRNIYAIQNGSIFPDEFYIYCAHYDAVTFYCADDNASGVAGVLEAARILSDYQLDYSVIYALWDEEEIGLVGSDFFASQADSNNMNIKGVLNFEMSGWDSDDDGLMDVHTRPISNSLWLSDFMFAVDSIYDLPVVPVIYNPGTTASDHSSFWNHNYSALCFSEAYYGGDFNPYYHSSQDRIDKFNLPYFHNVSKLGIATVASLAEVNPVVSVEENENIPQNFSINNYPNPFNSSTVIRYVIPEENQISLELYNSIGEKIQTLVDGFKSSGEHDIYLDANSLSSGMYLIVIRTPGQVYSHKILLLK